MCPGRERGQRRKRDVPQYRNPHGFHGRRRQEPDHQEQSCLHHFFTCHEFSLATKNSWKDRDTGEWNSHTEWHRVIVFGRLATFAATLMKGDHVQIQGQLRTREFDKGDKNGTTGKQFVTEIRVTSIFKLDRSATENAAEPPSQEAA